MKKIICFVIIVLSIQSSRSQDILKSYLNREYSRFSTNGLPKSLGLDIVIDIPKLFVASEGKRPHIVQKWSYQIPNTKACNIYITLLLTDMDQNSNQIWNENPENFSKLALGQSCNISTSGFTKFDGIRASYAVGNKSEYIQAYGVNLNQIIKMNNSVYNNKLIQISFTIAGADGSEVLLYYRKYESLFLLIVNSIAIQNQWK